MPHWGGWYNPRMTTDQFEHASAINHAYRRARLNVKYYGCRLYDTQRLATAIDILIAAGALTALAVLSLWKSEGGKIAFAVVASGTSFLAIARLFLQLPEKMVRYGQLWSAYNSFALSLERTVRDMVLHHQIPPESAALAESTISAMRLMADKEDRHPDKWLLARCDKEVRREIPADRLWWPSAASSPAV